MASSPTTEATAAIAGTVYGLVDPRDRRLRYVGGTIKPLMVRLAGHRSNPVPSCRAWIAELKAAGLTPEIVPLHEKVSIDRLLEVENDEITRRYLADEPILNIVGTGPARAIIRTRHRNEIDAARRAAWRVTADHLRAALGGPLPPWPVDVKIADDTWRAIQVAADRSGIEDWRLHEAAENLLSRDTAECMPTLDEYPFRKDPDLYRVCRGAAVGVRWDSPQQVAAYLSSIPWLLIAAAPWLALAHQAGIPNGDITAAAAWMSDDPTVHDTLALWHRRKGLLQRATEDLSAGNHIGTLDSLVTIGCAYTGYRPPDQFHDFILRLLQTFAKEGQLNRPLADLMAALNDTALDLAYGPNLAAKIDDRTGFPPGTAATILAELAILRPHIDELHPILRRHTARLATTDRVPLFLGLSGTGLTHIRAVFLLLSQRGLLTVEHPDDATLLDQIHHLWKVTPERRDHRDPRFRTFFW